MLGLGWLTKLLGAPPQKAALQQHVKVKVGSAVYTIRRINPVLDFPVERMPTIFSAYASARKVDPVKAAAAMDPRKSLEEMMMVVRAGVVEPALVEAGKGDAKGREEGITVEDLFRDPSHGANLYLAIMGHTLDRFRGLKKVFFSRKIRLSQFTVSQALTAAGRAQ